MSGDNLDEIATITNKLDILGRDMKNLDKSVYAIQVGCDLCEGMHLEKECPLKEEVNGVEEAKYDELGRTFPSNGSSRAKYRVRPSWYSTRVDNRLPFSERKPRIEDTVNKYI
ncbi:hypothetical protein Tco_0301785 [Tanacetum coccineum]